MSSEPSKKRLPFEPQSKKKKTPPNTGVITPKKAENPKKTAKDKEAASLAAIPDVVSKRMIKRMALFSGIPTGLGMLSFVVFYWIVTHDWLKVPTIAVVFVSMGLFGLGVLGLTYGILSTSWDEDRTGGWWGWEEFRINFKRMTTAWRSAKQKP